MSFCVSVLLPTSPLYSSLMDEITSLWDRLSLTAKEEVRVDLSGEQGTKGGVLAAKFFTKRVINMGNNRVMFLFENTMEMKWVMANSPWSFNKFLILLKRIDDDCSFSKVVFDSCAFWVQIHDLPPQHMTVAVCKKIASTLG